MVKLLILVLVILVFFILRFAKNKKSIITGRENGQY